MRKNPLKTIYKKVIILFFNKLQTHRLLFNKTTRLKLLSLKYIIKLLQAFVLVIV